jgi:AraC-like DNA-binding protein
MLIGRGHREIGTASVRWAYAFSGSTWFHVVRLEGLVFDTRFVPAASEPPRPGCCFYMIVRGEAEWFGPHGGRLAEKTALAMSLEHIEGANGRRPHTFRATGSPFVSIQLQVHAGADAVPAMPKRVEVGERAWSAASRAADLLQDDDDVVVHGLHELVRCLVEDGLVSPDVAKRALHDAPPSVVRIWKGVRPLIERMALGSTLEDLSRDASMPKTRARRYVEQLLLGFIGTGFRGLTHNLRLRTAVLFLTAEGASIADVAREVGYGSTAAMARAFRDAGLEAPTTLRERILATGTDDRRERK